MEEVKCIEHSGCTKAITVLEASDKLQWTAITNLQNRLPVWAVILIATLSGACGWLAK